MLFKKFDELLSLDIECVSVQSDNAALVVIGDARQIFAQQLAASKKFSRVESTIRVHFGLPILTALFPLLVGALMTEKNTLFDQLSLFAWIEDNYIYEPRAEVFGLTPFGEQPILFLRDFDLDRETEAWTQTQQPARWLHIVGVAVASSRYAGMTQTLEKNDAPLVALEHILPDDAREFVDSLRMDVARGANLKTTLRALRKSADSKLLNLCDGWRVLSTCVPFVRLNPNESGDAPLTEKLQLEARKW